MELTAVVEDTQDTVLLEPVAGGTRTLVHREQ